MKNLLSALSLISLSAATLNAVALVQTYDEQVTQTNTVNGSAAFSSATGGASASNVLDVATFKTSVESGFTSGFGGVLDFDSQINIDDQIPTTGITSPTSLSFDSGNKDLDLGMTLSSGDNVFRQGNLSNRTPISAGNGVLPGFAASTQDETPGTLTLAFGGAGGNEFVTQAGFTFLSRTSRDYGVVTAVATFDNGATVTSSFTNSIFTAGAQDTFFGYEAPSGNYITQITLAPDNDIGFSIDDIGIVTAAIPEPSTYGLVLGAMALGLLTVRRRR